jgi:hypothetical protein
MIKNVRIPYKKVQNYILVKLIDYDIRKRYKKVSYAYEEYNGEELVKTYIHRIGKPAVIVYRNNRIYEVQYWKNGKFHRLFGPAIITYDGKEIASEKWFQYGRKLTEQEIEDEKKAIDRRKKMMKVILKMKSKKMNTQQD